MCLLIVLIEFTWPFLGPQLSLGLLSSITFLLLVLLPLLQPSLVFEFVLVKYLSFNSWGIYLFGSASGDVQFHCECPFLPQLQHVNTLLGLVLLVLLFILLFVF